MISNPTRLQNELPIYTCFLFAQRQRMVPQEIVWPIPYLSRYKYAAHSRQMVSHPVFKKFQGTIQCCHLQCPVHPSISSFLQVKSILSPPSPLPPPMTWEGPHHCSSTLWQESPNLVSFFPKQIYVNSRFKNYFSQMPTTYKIQLKHSLH